MKTKTIFALLTVFLLSGIAVASAETQTGLSIEPVSNTVYSVGVTGVGLTDTYQWKTTGLNSEWSSLVPRYVSDGIIYPDGSFMEFVPLDEYRYVSGEGYVRNDGGTYTKEFGYGFFNWHPSYAAYKAEKAGKLGIEDTGFAAVSTEKLVAPESMPAKSSCSI